MRLLSFVVAASIVSVATVCRAEIDGSQHLRIDFTDATDVAVKVIRPTTDPAQEHGGRGDVISSLDGSFWTKPLAIGLAWRPTYFAQIRLTIDPPAKEIVHEQGGKTIVDSGWFYVRYSPDLVHWSSWQYLERREPEGLQEKQNPGQYFGTTVRVPYGERRKYEGLLRQYERRDVPWPSDEEAAVRWILQQQPDFFAKQLPFIGYVQFCCEKSSGEDVHIRSFQADVSFTVSGIQQPPKDEDKHAERQRSRQPWSFRAEETPPKAAERHDSSFGIPNDFSGKLSKEQERDVPESLHGVFSIEATQDISADELAEKLKSTQPIEQIAEETHDGTRYVALKTFRCVQFAEDVSGQMIVIQRYRVVSN